MPLPYLKKKCTAKSKRTGQPCNNPAAHGCRTCRMHGARRAETILKGDSHPQYTFGNETRAKRAIRADALKDIRIYSNLLKHLDRKK